jgi:hypothetical protein
MYVMNLPQPARPDLELRLGESRLELTNITVTHGSGGARMTGIDESGVFELTITISSGNQSHEVELRTLPIAGKLPHTVIGGLEFICNWIGGDSVTLAIPYGKALIPLGSIAAATTIEDAQEWLDIARNLVQLQSVCPQQLRIPESLTSAEAAGIDVAARLLSGEIVQSDWTATSFVIKNVDALGQCLATGPLFQFLMFRPFSIEYDETEYQLDGTVGMWGVAQLAEPGVAGTVAAGDSVSIIPGPDQKLFRQYSPAAAEAIGD